MDIPAVDQFFKFDGKVVIVTGSSRGIGRGIALRFASAGAAVVINNRNNFEQVQAVVELIKNAGGRAAAVQGDMTRKTDVERLVAETISTFGRLDVMVNNAGSYPSSLLVNMGEEEWDEVINSNLRSVFLGTQAAAKQMIAQGKGGCIINIASIEGEKTAPGHSHYNAAKAGVVMHTRTAARELGRHGIRVNVVSPGLIWREGLEQSWPKGVEFWLKTTPISRLGQPEDVADACLFLASPAARWISGVNLPVDGGAMAA
jgi:NAD(P)-dependent dehydrogenase (short-subunit alcohol dehydrogenase family)